MFHREGKAVLDPFKHCHFKVNIIVNIKYTLKMVNIDQNECTLHIIELFNEQMLTLSNGHDMGFCNITNHN